MSRISCRPMRACEPPLMQQEGALFDILRNAARHWFEDGGALVIEAVDGRTIRARRE